MLHRHDRTRSQLRGNLESLEAREVLSGGSFFQGPLNYVYTETENTNPGQNAVIAYAQNSSGQLTEIGSFNTGGTGVANTGPLGPQDSDKEVIASPDGRFIFAVNQGSNTIAVFRVHSDGSLKLINDSAFSSGGTEPVSLAIADGRLYVVNRGDEIAGQTGSIAPSITVFDVAPDGTLIQNFADTTTLPLGLSPSQVLTTPYSNLVFVDTFTPPPLNAVPEANEILPFQIGFNGQLIPAAGGGVGDPVTPPTLLGLSLNPTQNIIYAGLTMANDVGVFTFDRAGNLTLEDTVPVGLGGAGPCWATVSPNGQFLYTVDTGSNSVGVFSLANPLQPTQVQEFFLGGPQNSTGTVTSINPRETTAFEFSFDASGNYLFVIDHEQNSANGTFPQGNALHVLSVAANGTLTESANSPAFLPANIPAGADPQGVAVISASYFNKFNNFEFAPPINDFNSFDSGWSISLFVSELAGQNQSDGFYP
jgi:6-phosphogluconolactonase (cycloisomerase 2 family)